MVKFEFIALVILLELFLSDGVGGVHPGHKYSTTTILCGELISVQFYESSSRLHTVHSAYFCVLVE